LKPQSAGTLPAKHKELIAVAIAVHQGCSDCILFHVSNAKSNGATRSELAEVLAVCIEMGGGPSMRGTRSRPTMKFRAVGRLC
jgi:AhpD family alkylhydroperoxidase